MERHGVKAPPKGADDKQKKAPNKKRMTGLWGSACCSEGDTGGTRGWRGRFGGVVRGSRGCLLPGGGHAAAERGAHQPPGGRAGGCGGAGERPEEGGGRQHGGGQSEAGGGKGEIRPGPHKPQQVRQFAPSTRQFPSFHEMPLSLC
eukprot:991201-Prorocentrum_minimum.AAC.1